MDCGFAMRLCRFSHHMRSMLDCSSSFGALRSASHSGRATAAAEGHGAAHRQRADRQDQSRRARSQARTACSPCRRPTSRTPSPSTAPMLLALEQGTVTAQPPEFDAPGHLQGPAAPRGARPCRGGARSRSASSRSNGYTGWLDAGRHRLVGLDPRARGRRRAARHRPAGPALADQHARGRLQARRRRIRPLGLGACSTCRSAMMSGSERGT